MANKDSIYNTPIAPSPNKTITCQDLLQHGSYIHSGWLRRQSLRNRLKIFAWPQVYVVIAGGCVYCYSCEIGKRPATAFSLYGYDKVYRSGEITMKEATWAFKIVHANSEYRSYLFSASSEKEMAFWMKLFKHEMLRASGKLNRTQGDGKSDKSVYQDAGSESASSVTSQDYMEIEANIYEDSSQFVLPQNYTNKREDDESDDEMNVMVNTRPDLQDRPPQPPPVPRRPPKKTKPSESEDALVDELKQIGLRKQPQYAERPSNVSVQGNQSERSVNKAQKNELRTRGNPDGSSVKKEDSVEKEQAYPSDAGDFWSSIFFYGDKDNAAEIIRQIPDEGVFLLRVNVDKSMVLQVYANGQGRKFKVFVTDDKKFTLKNDSGHYFTRVEELVYFYYDNPLPGQKPEVKLTECYIYHRLYRNLKLT